MIKKIYHAFCYLYYRSFQLSTSLWKGSQVNGNMGAVNMLALLFCIHAITIILLIYDFSGIYLLRGTLNKGLFLLLMFFCYSWGDRHLTNRAHLIIEKFKNESESQRRARGWYIVLYIGFTVGVLLGYFWLES